MENPEGSQSASAPTIPVPAASSDPSPFPLSPSSSSPGSFDPELLALFDSIDLSAATESLDDLQAQKFSHLTSAVSLLSLSHSFSLHQRRLLDFFLTRRRDVRFLQLFDQFKLKLKVWRETREAIEGAGKSHQNAARIELMSNIIDFERFTVSGALRTFLLETLVGCLDSDWEKLFEVCSTSDGKRISKAERNALGLNSSNLVYGEVALESLAAVLWGLDDDRINPKLGTNKEEENLPLTFVDLGSGTGRAIYAAASLLNFSDFLGIEILSGLHQAAVLVQEKFQSEILKDEEKIMPPHRQGQRVTFQCDSFLSVDWSSADIVFANSTCFEEDLMAEISAKAAALRPGSYFISLTKRIYSPHFDLLSSTAYSMSWGIATVHIHKRKLDKGKTGEKQ